MYVIGKLCHDNIDENLNLENDNLRNIFLHTWIFITLILAATQCKDFHVIFIDFFKEIKICMKRVGGFVKHEILHDYHNVVKRYFIFKIVEFHIFEYFHTSKKSKALKCMNILNAHFIPRNPNSFQNPIWNFALIPTNSMCAEENVSLHFVFHT